MTARLSGIAWIRRRFAPNTLQTTLLLAGFVGLTGALTTVMFREALHWLQWAFAGHETSGVVAMARGMNWWQRLLLPTAGGLVAGLILQYVTRWVPKKGSDDYMEAIAIGTGVLSLRQTLVKCTSSLFSVSSGASIGREGPMVQLAAMVSSVVGRVLALPAERLRLLVACGATAGITSAYNAPIAGALFISEIVYGSVTTATLGPLVVASVVANIVIRQFLGYEAVYQMPRFDFVSGWEVFFYLGLGLIAGVTGPLFLRLLDSTKAAFGRLSLPLYARMTLGGLIVGVLSVKVPEVWGNGYSVVNSILHTPWAWQSVAVVLLFKLAATAASSGSGAIGGVFTPTLFVGAAMGCLYGLLMHALWPETSAIASSYTVVGMGAFLAATTYAPLMSILMIFEMTLSYQVVLPLMLACITGYVTAHALRPDSMYSKSLRRNQAASRWVNATPGSETVRIGSLASMNDAVILENIPARDIEARFTDKHWSNLVVLDGARALRGLLRADAWWRRKATSTPDEWRDLIEPCKPVPADLSVAEGLHRAASLRADWIPVTETGGQLLGVVAIADLVGIVTREQQQADEKLK